MKTTVQNKITSGYMLLASGAILASAIWQHPLHAATTGQHWAEKPAGSASGTGVSKAPAGVSGFPAMAHRPSDGSVYVAWPAPHPDSGLPEIYVRRWNGSSWQALGGSAAGGGISQTPDADSIEPAMVVRDSDGHVFVAWQERMNEDNSDIFAAEFDPATSQWSRLGPDDGNVSNLPALASVSPSILLMPNKNHQPVVAWQQFEYNRSTSLHAVFVRHWTGLAWAEMGTGSADKYVNPRYGGGVEAAGINADDAIAVGDWDGNVDSDHHVASFLPRLIADPSGNVAVAFLNGKMRDGNIEYLHGIHVRRFNGEYSEMAYDAWEEIGRAEGGHPLGVESLEARSVAVAGQAAGMQLYVAAEINTVGTSSFSLKSYQWTGSGWSQVGAGSLDNLASSPFGSHVPILQPALALDSAGQLVVAWTHVSGESSEIYVRWTSPEPAGAVVWKEFGTGSASGGGVSSTAGLSGYPALVAFASGGRDHYWLAWQDGVTSLGDKPQIFVRANAGGGTTPSTKPEVTDPGPQEHYVGQSVAVPLTASNAPDKFNVQGLPGGLRYDPGTRSIVGRPTAFKLDRGGNPLPYLVKISATNKAGTGAVIPVNWTIRPLPARFVGGFTGLKAFNLPAPAAAEAETEVSCALSFSVAKTGTVSGKLTLGARVIAFRGALSTAADGSEAALVVNIPASKTSEAISISLTLNADGSFEGTVDVGDVEMLVSGWHHHAAPPKSVQGQFHAALESASPTSGEEVQTLLSFDGENGSKPYAKLVVGSGGAFYGTTLEGGASGQGTIFKISPGGTQTVLHQFNGSNGRFPSVGLVQGNDGNLYGTTLEGGTSGQGTVFKITPSGTHTLLHSFSGSSGYRPFAGLEQGSDGSFYGATAEGGINGDGTVFKITPSGTHTVLHHFNNINGRYPSGGLVLGSDGNFFGTTVEGGASGYGTVFKITPSGTHTLLHSFNSSNGSYPSAELVQGSDGSFYGTAQDGGASGYGSVFKITPSGTFTLLHSFNYSDGDRPYPGLIQGWDGDFYGMTTEGGTSGAGTIFKISPSGTHTVLLHFDGSNGRYPHAGLMQGADGDFYGTTVEGGASGHGMLFKFGANGANDFHEIPQGSGYATVKISSKGVAAWTVRLADGTPITGSFGVSEEGWVPFFARLYKNTGGLHGWCRVGDEPARLDGEFSWWKAAESASSKGRVYRAGIPEHTLVVTGGRYGLNNQGLILDFIQPVTAENGRLTFTGAGLNEPWLQAFDLKLKNAVQIGQGTSNPNTATLKLDAKSGIFTGSFLQPGSPGKPRKATFSGLVIPRRKQGVGHFLLPQPGDPGAQPPTSDTTSPILSGAVKLQSVFYNPIKAKPLSPSSGLVRDPASGWLYGVSVSSDSGFGTIYRMSAEGLLETVFQFDEEHVPGNTYPPVGELTFGRDGNLYGTTGDIFAPEDAGMIFRITPEGRFTSMAQFNGRTHGGWVQGRLHQHTNGMIYGLASFGGEHDAGTLFRLTTSGVLELLFTFSGGPQPSPGASPRAGLLELPDGTMLGLAREGGSSGDGALFKATPQGAVTLLTSFSWESNGNQPCGPLVAGPNGLFYGCTEAGGPEGYGTVFRVGLSGNIQVVTHFTGYEGPQKGAYPESGLIAGIGGSFYGTTPSGGAFDGGTVFRMEPDGSFTTLVEFDGLNGARPIGSLLQLSNGDIYGTTSRGGAHDQGTVFKVTPDGVHAKLVEFGP
jgi:uncharacterized repeat protein (TIGR03803 family)